MSINKFILMAGIASTLAGAAMAQATPDEVRQLGGRLTEFGAERAGNADGSIPPYTGGLKAAPADFKPGSGRYPDPFKDEKPLFTVDAKNMAQYAQWLTAGSKAMLERFPTFKMNVYKAHRTMGYPDWVLKNTVRNATAARLTGEGDKVEGAYAGIPFPVPKSGNEVLWNVYLRYQGPRYDVRFETVLVDRSGRKTTVSNQRTSYMFTYYDPKADKLPDWNYVNVFTTIMGPPAQAGVMFLQKHPLDYTSQVSATWIYTPGQRRVRMAPEAKYDTPAATIGGAYFYEEIAGYNGRMDRFDYKIVGKQEMLVPYNNYQALYSPDLGGEQHENPDVMRYEKHRVWVVEGTLKADKRHAYSKRRFYIDEDSWQIVQSEAYDPSGKMHRVINGLNFVPYDKPRVGTYAGIYYDLNKGNYAHFTMAAPELGYQPFEEVPPQSRFTPDTLGAMGVR